MAPRRRPTKRSTREAVVDTLEIIYGPVLIGLIFSYLFVTNDAIQETILAFIADTESNRALAKETSVFSGPGESTGPGLVLLLRLSLLLLVPAALWSAARYALDLTNTDTGWPSAALPRALGVIVGLSIIVGFVRAQISPEGNGTDAQLAMLVIGLLFFGTVIVFVLHDMIIPRLRYGRYRIWAIILLALTAMLIFAIALLAPGWAEMFGPFGVTALFIISAAYGIGTLTVLSQFMPGRFPLIVVALAISTAYTSQFFAFGSAAFALALLTVVYLRDSMPRGTVPVVACFVVVQLALGSFKYLKTPCETLPGCNLIQGVTRQLDAPRSPRLAQLVWERKERPVMRIVAAQGGGLFAAYHTAYYLAARADTEKDFADSLFLISGVSGGSVGAGVYWAIRQAPYCREPEASATCHRDAVRKILRRDFLSPALAGLFFRDSFDNFIPISAMRAAPMDRGNVLEFAFKRAIREWHRDNLPEGIEPPEPALDQALTSSWDPDIGAPLLLFNSTDVSTGDKVVLSPLSQLSLSEPGRLDLPDTKDLTVSNGMVMSARFPIVTPPGRVRIAQPEADGSNKMVTLQLVDGGYFDNSGIETLQDLVPTLAESRDYYQKGATEIEIIVFGDEEPAPAREIKGTLGAPASAFTGAWRARNTLSLERFRAYVDRLALNTGKIRVCPARTYPEEFNFTVSWYLAERTFSEIEYDVHRELGLESVSDEDPESWAGLKFQDDVPADCHPQ